MLAGWQCVHVRRRLGTADAVVLGLGAMLGAGVFTAFTPAARAAGGWLLLALVLAAVVATCNAVSSADLAANYPQSGGTYVYADRLLGRWPARLAGVAFVVGKTSSAAAAAGTLGAYLAPQHPLPVALGAVAVLTMVNMAGLRKTVAVTWVLVAIVLAVLAVVVVAGLAGGPVGQFGQFGYWTADQADLWGVGVDYHMGRPAVAETTPQGVLTAAGLLFFAFAGYARMATLGEEVRDPRRTLRLAIPLALGAALLVYFAVAVALLVGLGADRLAIEPAPLAALVSDQPGLVFAVRLGAGVAVASALLSVLVGVSRTTLAMARGGDLPAPLAHVGRRDTPWRADLAGGAVAALIAVLAGPAAAIALSACCVLVYYAVANAAALCLPRQQRRWPPWTALLGLALCCLLAVALPSQQVQITVLVLVGGTCVTALISRTQRLPH
jgi:basic amino acid/polyamine antiporter, APA family